MFLNIGGAVLGVAVLTVLSDSVTSNNGGKGRLSALLDGYRAGYYGTIAMTVIGFVAAFFFYDVADATEEQVNVAETEGVDTPEGTSTPESDVTSVRTNEKTFAAQP